MANHTIELRHIVESGIPIFSFNYPFYDEKKKQEFEERFIKHFYFREIGCETIERFKWYLEDKMTTVFPYYNELFKSASIEYDVLDNYKLTETYTRNVESDYKNSGISSSVGRMTDKQDSETNETKNVDSNETANSSETAETKGSEIANAESSETVTNNTTSSTTSEGDENKTLESTKNESQKIKKAFLDTPQGLTDLTDSKYLTTLNQDEVTANETINNSENSSSEQSTKVNATADTTTKGSNENNSEHSATTDSNASQSRTGNEKIVGNANATTTSEQKSTNDNNTRSYTTGETSESYTLTRRGNIGVDTDSDAIEKHNRLQKTLKNIEIMFFDECEDLFMLVW